MFTAIFDLDGTLIDTALDLLLAGNATYEEIGIDFRLTPGQDEGISSGGGRSMIRYGLKQAGREFTEKTVDDLYPVLLSHYDKTIDANSYVYDGIEQALVDLQDNGWFLGICTNKPEHQANEILNRFNIRHYFKSVIGADTMSSAKPNPEPLIASIERAGGTIHNSVLIGDTETDFLTAKAASVPIILVGYGHGAITQNLSSMKPSTIIEHPNEIAIEAVTAIKKYKGMT